MLRFIAGPFLHQALLDCGVSPKRITIVTPDKWYRFQAMTIKPEPLLHDVENYGLRIHLADGSKVFYATDTASLSHLSVPGYDLYLVEGNYDKEELEATIARKLQAGEFIYEYRSKVTHMDKQKTIDWLYKNMGRNSQYILIHQHKDREATPCN